MRSTSIPVSIVRAHLPYPTQLVLIPLTPITFRLPSHPRMPSSRSRLRRRVPSLCHLGFTLPLPFALLYLILVLLQLHLLLRTTSTSFIFASSSHHHSHPQHPAAVRQPLLPQPISLNASLHPEHRTLCRHRRLAARTILMHMHIPKSGGTAFALALSSECRCRIASRPRKGYCKQCPHVLPDTQLPPATLHGNLWTITNHSFSPYYTSHCATFHASSRWFGFPKRNRTQTFYSQNRLTSGWPCGVHVGYARLRMCASRLRLAGIRHVIVTVFRQPAARLVSEFYQVAYNRRVITSWDWCKNVTAPFDLTSFLQSSVDMPFQSRVTKLLSGSPVQTGAAGESWTMDSNARTKAFHRALNVVQNADDLLFGLAEHLGETLRLFEFAFRRRFTAPGHCHSHQNSSGCAQVKLGLHDRYGHTMNMTDEQQRLFHRNNHEDVSIYDTAVTVFWRRVAAMRDLQALGSDFAIDRRCDNLLGDDVSPFRTDDVDLK